MNDKASIIAQLAPLYAEQIRLTQELSKAKFGKKQKIRKALREIEQSIEGLEKILKKFDTNDMREVGFQHGIDTRGNQFGHASNALTGVASSLFSPGGGIFSKGRADTLLAQKGKKGNAGSTPILLIVLAVILLLSGKR